jgi:hypothetical protein
LDRISSLPLPSRQIETESGVNDLFEFDVERRKQMAARRERPKDLLSVSRPITLGGRLCWVGPLSSRKDVPRKIAVRICGSVPCDATGATAIVFENDGRKRCHTVGMINDHCDRLVRQVPLKGGLPVIVLPSAQASFGSLDRRVAERELDLLGGYRLFERRLSAVAGFLRQPGLPGVRLFGFPPGAVELNNLFASLCHAGFCSGRHCVSPLD